MEDKPQLYLYSKGDEICTWKSINDFVDEQRKNCKVVEEHLWEDSPHVQHLRKYPDEYKAKISKFLTEKARIDK